MNENDSKKTKKRREEFIRLVAKFLNKEGENARIVKRRDVFDNNESNSLIINCNRGLIHITATGLTESNSRIIISRDLKSDKGFLFNVQEVAYCWKDEEGKNISCFVKAEKIREGDIRNKSSLTKNEIRELSYLETEI